ncbi:hypothetical protein [Bradyrhizobium sp. CCBAU 51753]|uniref:hypothetical protein n=1 Tax=Bradyrhizobium sp. CCBAU 51753 TaxID=1325100 RepID=UPI00188B4EE1|nr:hypothetical protein [Bradyrhizobium sp. CCBAU 51753]
MVSFPLELRIPSQGVSLDIPDASGLKEFFRVESSFYAGFSGLLSSAIVIGNTNYGEVSLPSRSSQAFDRILRDIETDAFGSFEEYVASAQQL